MRTRPLPAIARSLTRLSRLLSGAAFATSLWSCSGQAQPIQQAQSSQRISVPSVAQAQVPAPVMVPVPSPPPAAKPAVPALRLQPQVSLPPDQQLFRGMDGRSGDRSTLLRAIDQSLRYLNTNKAAADYGKLKLAGISRERVRRSVVRFRQLLVQAKSPEALQAAVNREFVWYQASGKDGQGTVGFTGYFEPVHTASPIPTAEYRYPLFRLPVGFASWPKPHPSRLQLEGANGLQFGTSPLKGRELVWLRDRLEAFLIQVQGSARLNLTNGGTMTVGYAGHTEHPYVGIGRELVKDGKLRPEDLTLPNVIAYFQQNPADLDVYLPRNQRFVFFTETGGAPALGSLGVPVSPERSIATDKSLFPPGALAAIQANLPYPTPAGPLQQQLVTRYVLDQDTGGAIKGPGRVDVFMGTGKGAGDRAGLINSTGQLYYLLLR
jgi:membrane-bound lytic murein transglycosylase A